MPIWRDVLLAVAAAAVTAVVTSAGMMLRWSWWAGARVERVDNEMANLGKRIDRIEKVLDVQAEEHGK